MKQLTALLLVCAVSLCIFSSCGRDIYDSDDEPGASVSESHVRKRDKSSKDKDSSSEIAETTETNTPAAESSAEDSSVLEAKREVLNYTKPVSGEKIIIMTIKDMGEVKIKVFPELVPKAVENFIGHAENGYYDGLTFHRVINEFMIQGGCPLGTGTGGESVWGGRFDGGTSDNLIHCAGAVAYANSGSTASNGSQFYIVTGNVYTDEELYELEEYNRTSLTPSQREIYKTQGGTPFLDGNYTVFGQVIEGFDIVKEIQSAPTDYNDKPIEPVIIESVRTEVFNGNH